MLVSGPFWEWISQRKIAGTIEFVDGVAVIFIFTSARGIMAVDSHRSVIRGGVGLTVKFRPRGSDLRNAMLLGPSSHTHLPPGFTASMALQRCFYFLVLATIQILFLNSVISTTSLPSTSSSTPTTEFPISQVAYWSPADDCVRSCATAATSQYANSLSCTNSNPIPCICQNPIDPANSARECALLSCSAPATDPDIVGIQGKEIILQ